MRTLALAAALALVSAACAHAPSAAPGAARAPASHRPLPRATTNHPDGDYFVGTAAEQGRIVDGYLADDALAGPVELYLAASTAERLGRREDAAYLFYAAQMRKQFEYQRRGIDPRVAQELLYLPFLNQTVGARVNPVMGREPDLFIAAIARLEDWTLLPAPGAPMEEFEAYPTFKVPAAEWPALARKVKEEFMTLFGRKVASLLTEPAFREALQYAQAYNSGGLPHTDETKRKYEAALATMHRIEQQLFPKLEQLF